MNWSFATILRLHSLSYQNKEEVLSSLGTEEEKSGDRVEFYRFLVSENLPFLLDYLFASPILSIGRIVLVRLVTLKCCFDI